MNNDEGSSTPPMTVLAAARLSNCTMACGGRVEPTDRCMALAGSSTVEEGELLTVMVYCIPTLVGAGVWRNNDLTWSVPGSAAWLNDVLDVQILQNSTGEQQLQLVVLRFTDGEDSPMDGSFLHRVDVFNSKTGVGSRQLFPASTLQFMFPDARSIVRILAGPVGSGVVLAQVPFSVVPFLSSLFFSLSLSDLYPMYIQFGTRWRIPLEDSGGV